MRAKTSCLFCAYIRCRLSAYIFLISMFFWRGVCPRQVFFRQPFRSLNQLQQKLHFQVGMAVFLLQDLCKRCNKIKRLQFIIGSRHRRKRWAVHAATRDGENRATKLYSIVSSSQFSGNVSWSAASTHSSLSRSRLHVLSLKCHVLMYNSFLEDMFGLDRHHPSLKVEEIIGRNRKPNPRSIRRIRSYDTAGVIRARRSICCVDNEPWAPSYVRWMLYDW